MILFPAITVTPGAPFIFHFRTEKWAMPNTLKHLIAWVDDADLFVGNVPDPPITLFNIKTIQDQTLVLPVSIKTPPEIPSGFAGIFPGYVWSETGDPADNGNFVIANHGHFLEMRNAFVGVHNDVSAKFTPPDVTSANGIVLVAGNSREWTTDLHSRFLDRPIKFVAATATTAILRLAYEC